MRTKYTVFGLVSLGVLLLIGVILANQMSPTVAQHETQRIPTPVGGQAHPTPIIFPTSGPLRTSAIPRDAWRGTIELAEGQVAAQRQHLTNGRYVIRQDETYTRLFLVDTTTGQELRLGTDQGYAFFNTLTSDYVIWGYQCVACEPGDTLTTGVYIYDMAQGTTRSIVQGVSAVSPKIAGDHIVYLLSGTLFVYHLETEETIEVTRTFDSPTGDNEILCCNTSPKQFYAISDTSVVWLTNGLHIFDLTTSTIASPNLPETVTQHAYDISASDTVVIWFTSEGWWGYDLPTETLFPISIVPPGWEQLQIQELSSVAIEGNTLIWSVHVNDQEYTFTAPVVRNEQ